VDIEVSAPEHKGSGGQLLNARRRELILAVAFGGSSRFGSEVLRAYRPSYPQCATANVCS